MSCPPRVRIATFVCFPLICVFVSEVSISAEVPARKLLLSGRYAEIGQGKTPETKAIWAFAQHQLRPGIAALKAAEEAHAAGLDLGSYVVMECHRKGMAVRRSEKTANAMNHQLRTKLVKKKDPSAIELYILSNTYPGDKDGIVRTDKPDESLQNKFKDEELRWGWLVKSAEKGFTQAMDEVGRAYQNGRKEKEAYTWYSRAAREGLAAGLRNQGYLKMMGWGTRKDVAESIKTTRKAAEAGDVFAMINMGVYRDRGMGLERDGAKARQWIDRAGDSGHFMGAIEKGLALLAGNYGYKKSEKQGKAYLRKGIESRNGEALLKIASFYARGTGLKKNGKKAVEFAEAAFSQGETSAAGLLAHIFRKGIGGVKKDEAIAKDWQAMGMPSLAFAIGLEDSALAKRLLKLDPWKANIE